MTTFSDSLPPPSGSHQINVGNTERVLSLLGGAALLWFGLRRPTIGSIMQLAVGSGLLYRGASGHCPMSAMMGRNTAASSEAAATELRAAVTVDRPRHEVYAFWRELENLPRFMRHLEKVEKVGNRRSHWEARVPAGVGRLTWDAEITVDEENERIAWRSLPGAMVDNAGEVRFADAPEGRGTEVRAIIDYRAPAGDIGRLASRVLNPIFRQMVREDIRRFKSLMESGEVATIEGQPSGRNRMPDSDRGNPAATFGAEPPPVRPQRSGEGPSIQS